MKIHLLLYLFLITSFSSIAQEKFNPKLLTHFWEASWVSQPHEFLQNYGVYHFRKSFDLSQKPEEFIINISADNRYKLFVNGHYIGNGPSRGSLQNWRFETYDIAEYLQPGKNVLAAVVWNFGEHIPAAQITQQTALVVQGNTEKEWIVNTDDSWKVMKNEAYQPIPLYEAKLNAYLVVGAGEKLDAAKYPWEWEKLAFDDSNWNNVRVIERAKPIGLGTDGSWLLTPRTIPQMTMDLLRMKKIVRTEGIEINDDFLTGNNPIAIPANTEVKVLIDQSYLTVGYPELKVKGGKGSEIKITYSEALFDENNQKGNRDKIEGKKMRGYFDIYLPDGNVDQTYHPLWNRTYRYIQLDIKTGNAPLTIEDFYGYLSVYPFEEKGSFSSDNEALEKIWDTGWRTARLCGLETYVDCPYYEQLQYVGDTRIQAFISLYVAGDDRLMKKSILNFKNSILPNGLTQSRYPCSKMQLIPTYSLFWVTMIHDYWMHRDDEKFVKDLIPAVRNVLEWYEQQLDENQMLGAMKWWNFVDWTEAWKWNEVDRIGGVPAGVKDGNSAIISLQYAYTIDYAVQLFNAFGEKHLAEKYAKISEDLKKATYDLCWNEEKGLIADTPEKTIFSQHANILAILSGAIPQESVSAVMEKTMYDTSIIQASFYFKFYLFQAMKKSGYGHKYLEQIKPWQEMLDIGLTTFAEKPDPTRSDCHAWSASPNYDFLALICGIETASPGFKTVKIAPNLGDLNKIKGSIPHPNGALVVDLNKTKNGIEGTVTLPPRITGIFEWEGKQTALKAGDQKIKF
ncbi:family 78 glycoside hydrolase catalytic domain [Flexithrix dorotheae]|uniref:family 78 glycoside hydrolase catalytic domain n=1 Tax=Flexithrix dorotheae TaxID=70993 RepID=UPI0003652DD3|nr:family 78 glycoside hydrolase catalytic domain [Flexithrix dorotheae]